MSRTCIKFCGLNKIDDLVYADSLDIDLLGLIFTSKSPRFVNEERLKEIASLKITKPLVGVFMDQPVEYVNEIMNVRRLDYLQFHGSESYDYCKSFNTPFIKTIHIGSEQIVVDQILIKNASMTLFDTQIYDQKGGTGTRFDWSQLINDQALQDIIKTSKYLVAGGLNLENINDLLVTYNPKGIDVSSGLEYDIGKKDHEKMERFVNIVRTNDS
mgnify:FL=1